MWRGGGGGFGGRMRANSSWKVCLRGEWVCWAWSSCAASSRMRVRWNWLRSRTRSRWAWVCWRARVSSAGESAAAAWALPAVARGPSVWYLSARLESWCTGPLLSRMFSTVVVRVNCRAASRGTWWYWLGAEASEDATEWVDTEGAVLEGAVLGWVVAEGTVLEWAVADGAALDWVVTERAGLGWVVTEGTVKESVVGDCLVLVDSLRHSPVMKSAADSVDGCFASRGGC